MENVITGQKGNYILVMSLKRPAELIIPKFGNVCLLPGFYFYYGSAHGSGGLNSRITRHLNSKSKQYWHIDYIKNQMHIFEVWCQISLKNNGCRFSHFFSSMKNAVIVINGFGASDCKNMCDAHLCMFPANENTDCVFVGLSKKFEGIFKIYPYAH